MKIKLLPPVEFLKECFVFDGSVGLLIWNIRPLSHFTCAHRMNLWNSRYAEKSAGCLLTPFGYLFTRVDRTSFLNHRIAWKMTYGVEPRLYLDHINGVKNDNRICNLREATSRENKLNAGAHKDNRLQVKGVWEMSNGRFRAKLWEEKKNRHIGVYGTLEEAKAAYNEAARKLHGDFFHS